MRPVSEVMWPKYSLDAFALASVDERNDLQNSLAQTATRLLKGSRGSEFHKTVRAIVEQLRHQGHELWSFDEDDDFEIWGPDYTKPRKPGLVVTFRSDFVDVAWQLAG